MKRLVICKIAILLILSLLVSATTSFALDKSSLVGAWLLDGKSGDEIKDSSGNNLHGEIVQGTKRVDGKFDGALQFNGADMARVADDAKLDLESFTISAWIKVEGQSGKWQIIASKENRGPTARNYGIFCNINTGVIHYSFTTGNAWKSFDAQTVVTDGSWHHIAATYENPNFKMYLDGTVDAEVTPGTKPDTHDNYLFIGGCDIGDYWMTGIIDEILLFNKALSDKEIGELQRGLSLPVQPGQKVTATWGKIKKLSIQ
jgi:hypothetical protein